MEVKNNLIKLIKRSLSPEYAHLGIENIKLGLKLNCNYNETCFELGGSKLGGKPDLPKFIDWPVTSDNEPYLFIAQINLKDVVHHNLNIKIPLLGVIYFFIKTNYPYKGEVIFVEDVTSLEHEKLPSIINKKKTFLSPLFSKKNSFKVFPCASVYFEENYTTPDYSSLYYELEMLKSGNVDSSSEIIIDEEIYFEQIFNEQRVIHQFLGHYKGVQNEHIEFSIEDDKYTYNKLSQKTIPEIEKALEWILLLQIDADKNLDFYWGDSGRIYFFIKRKDLQNGNFSNIKSYWDTH
jgi:uncharacterized protein YwqG